MKSGSCWKEDLQDQTRDPGHVVLPWVGADYDTHRILLVSNNQRGNGELQDELGVVAVVQEAMEQGHTRVAEHMGSSFGPACAMYADAAVRRCDGKLPAAQPRDPRKLAEEGIHRRFARLQTVKCAPQGARENRPSPTMGHNCPETYLGGSLPCFALAS